MIQGTLVGLSTGEWRTLHKCSTQFGERWVFSAAYIGRIRGLRLGKLGASADFGHPDACNQGLREAGEPLCGDLLCFLRSDAETN